MKVVVCVLFCRFVKGRAGRGVVAEEVIYVRGGPERAWRWRHISIGVGPAADVAVEGGISLDNSLDRKAGRLCSPFSRGCTKPFKGRERGRRIALG